MLRLFIRILRDRFKAHPGQCGCCATNDTDRAVMADEDAAVKFYGKVDSRSAQAAKMSASRNRNAVSMKRAVMIMKKKGKP